MDNNILPDSQIRRKVVLKRLDKTLRQLSHEEQAKVWRGVALNLAEDMIRASHDATHRPRL